MELTQNGKTAVTELNFTDHLLLMAWIAVLVHVRAPEMTERQPPGYFAFEQRNTVPLYTRFQSFLI